MRRLKCLSLVLLSGVLSLLLPSTLLVSNTSAIAPGTYRTVKNFNFYLNTTNSSVISLNTIADNISQSYSVTTNANAQSVFMKPSIVLNNTVPLSKTKKYRLLFRLNVNSVAASNLAIDNNNIVYNIDSSFICPRGDSSQKLYVSNCEIISYQKEIEPNALGPSDTIANGYTFFSNRVVEDFYVILDVFYNLDSQSNFSTIQLLDKLLIISNRTPLPAISTFKFYYLQSLQFEDDSPDSYMNKKDNEDRSNINEQQDSVDSGSDSSQQSAENTGTTLLAAFSSFVTAITSASPSNCNIDMDLGNLDLGIVNFCTLSPPPEFQVLGSIFLILFCVPLSIATARKVISLFRSFQG